MDAAPRTQDTAQFAIIGIATILAFIMIVVLVATPTAPYAWLMLGAPVSMVLSAITRLRRLRRHGTAR